MPRKSQVLLISAFHDYRTAKRASIHQVADALVAAGYGVSFVSTRFSSISSRTGDSRVPLARVSNRVQVVNEVRCLLWRTALHPFSSGNDAVDWLMGHLYPIYADLPSAPFDALVRQADYIIVESSAAAIYLRRLRRLNPTAKLIYYAADRLDTVGAHPFIHRRLVSDQALIDHFSLRASQMKEDFTWATGPLFKAGFGIDEAEYANVGPSPYPTGRRTAVSIGSMLFDPSVFQRAAPHFPDVEFHVIGCGMKFEAPPNVTIHPEMPFSRTLPYVKHASIGIAAYLPAKGCDYLSESSLKLAQFQYFALPAVCPSFAVGSVAERIGYTPGDDASIRRSVSRALALAGTVKPHRFPSWQEVALDVIEPVERGVPRLR